MNYLQDLRYKGLLLLQYLIILGSLAATLIAIINSRQFSSIIINIIPGLIILIIIFLQRANRKRHNWGRIFTLVVLNLLALPILWYNSPGVNSAIPLYSLMIIILSAFFAEKMIEFLLPLAGLGVSVFMIRYTLINPDFFSQFPNHDTYISTFMISFIIVSGIIMLAVFLINKSFQKDNEKFFNMSITDELTGLYNRIYFFKSGLEAFEDFIRYSTKFTVLMIDLDSLKEVNDQHGHSAGDLVLEEFARILSDTLRTVDIPARIGGEEFAVILKNTDLKQTANVAERIRETLEETEIKFKKDILKITCSIGGQQVSSMSNSFDDVLLESEKKMTQAKEKGRNKVILKL
ncbi:GGDEF domain-containing protein [Eubacteriaceae bacterium ES3]|nr:GGDEF domain-containing protein [Eubacteriaceae bacterium ES3]